MNMASWNAGSAPAGGAARSAKEVLLAPVMYFRHADDGSSGAPVPFLAMTPPATSAVVLSLLHAFEVGASTRGTATAGTARPVGDSSKRARHADSAAAECEESGGPSDGVEAASTSVKKKKYTYIARKEEREQLEREIRELEARAQQLRDACADGPTGVDVVSYENAKMREAAFEQQRVIASVQSVVTEFTNGQSAPPLNAYIHLTRDLSQRRELLLSLQQFKLGEARRFLAARTKHMTLGRESWEESRFRTPDGDFCDVRLDVSTYSGTTAKAVLDGILFFVLNAEISITEANGLLTVRENDDHDQTGVLHHRLVTTSTTGLQVEKNAVMFYERADDADSEPSGEYALITSDFVDRDDLHPYQRSERIRKDLTVVMKVETHRKPGAPSNGQEDVVVLTRWMFQKLYAPQLKHRRVSTREMEELQTELVRTMDGILSSVQQSVDASCARAK